MLDQIIADSYESRRNAARSKRMVLVKRKNQTPVADLYQDELISDSDSPDTTAPEPAPQNAPEKPYRQHYSLYGDFLYWQPFINDSYWGYKSQSSTSNKEYRFQFDWDMGFRVGAAFKTTWENLTIDGNWTNFHTSSTNSHEDASLFGAATGSFPKYNLYTRPYSAFTFGNAWKVKSKYKVYFDQFDLTFKRAIGLSKNFTLSPFAGVRALATRYSLDATSYTTYFGTNLSTPNGSLDNHTLNVSDKMKSIGLLGGLNANLQFGYGFGFYFGGDFFIGYGYDKIKTHSKNNFAGVVIANNSLSQNTYSIRTMFDLSTGFSWDHNFAKNRLNLLFSAGYEFHMLNDSPVLLYNGSGSDPSYYNEPAKSTAFQGLTARFGLGF